MPLAVLALLAMPFGLEGWPLQAMGWGCDLIIDIAHWVGDWPGAVVLIPALPVVGLLVMSFGLIWLCLIIGRLKWLGLAFLIAGCLTPLAIHAPDILAFADGKNSRLVAVMDADGQYRFSSTRAAKIPAETWLRRNAQEKRLPFPQVAVLVPPLDSHQHRIDAMRAPIAVAVSAPSNADTCSADWCRFDTRMGYVAVALTEAGAGPACQASRLVISLEPIKGFCRSADGVIDFFDLWRHGTHAISIKGDGSFAVTRAADVGDRPWALQRFPKPAQPVEAAPGEGSLSTDASDRSGDPGS
jgi:competence protein ComEC